jgi:two-component system, NtrC family, response regulator HydG
MQELYRQVLRAASSDANVLVTGESGVGKELVARALHDNAARNEGPFVSVHCAALPETLLESELFGHAKGAFSGANATRIGRFEAANGGSLLLDEIGEVPLATQVKLLRVLQEREIVRIGENQPRAVDVRVIAATNRDLGEMVRLGQFREDLYYRLYVLPLRVPALRERREDISLLATKLLDALAERYRRPRLRVSAAAIDALERCDWPGNVRQLFNALEYAVVQCDGTMIDVGHLPTEIVSAPGQPVPAVAHEGATRYWRKPATDDAERTMILDMLEQTGGNKAEAARRLGMSRTTLWKRLRNEI